MKIENVVNCCTDFLEPFGFDLIKPFNVSHYNHLVFSKKNKLLMRENSLGIIIGNTRNFWNPFMKEYELNLKDSLNPVDEYTENVIKNLVKLKFSNVKHFVKFSHDVENGEIISMQKACHVSGLAFNEENIGLCIHPIYGPWFALRAVIVFDLDAPLDPVEIIKEFPGSELDLKNMKLEMKKAIKNGNWLNVRNVCQLGKEFKYSQEQIDYHYYGKI
jgi:hypothetical protein